MPTSCGYRTYGTGAECGLGPGVQCIGEAEKQRGRIPRTPHEAQESCHKAINLRENVDIDLQFDENYGQKVNFVLCEFQNRNSKYIISLNTIWKPVI